MGKNIGLVIWAMTIVIIVAGLLALYSASYHNIRISNEVFYDQLLFAIVGLVIMFLISKLDYRNFYELAYVFYAGAVILLILVLVSGRHALGATRWFSIGGISFQPSEMAKFGLILTLARYFSTRNPSVSFETDPFGNLWPDLFVPLLITMFPMLLIFKQPDLGTALLFVGIFFIMLFASGLKYKYIAGFLGVCLFFLPFAWHILKPYQRDRLLVFLNPNIDPLGAGYTIIQSKIAVGSGKFLGKGWLSGTQNQLNFLPERHTDFIFSVIGEEWGLIGTIIVLGCYFVLIWSGLKIAEQVKDKFGMQLTVGIIAIFTLQVVINIGMVLGLCPVVGLTLPLISFGRSSFITFMIMLGFLLNLSRRRTVF
ncbi:MAG: rod shape-determining protein RodA [Candidatus Omnitrophota bacterium]